MKVVNEKGKLFGFINLIDLLVILVILAVVFGVLYQVFGTTISTASSVAKEISFDVRIRGVSLRWAEEARLQIDNGHTQIISGNDYVKDAYVSSLSVEPYVVQLFTDDGNVVETVDPYRYDLLFTVTAKTSVDSAVIKMGTQEIRVGYGHFLKTQTLEFSGNIERLVLPQ